MKAFVLVSLQEGSERKLLDQLKKHSALRRSYILFGEWDLLLEVEFSSAEELGTFVMERIRSRKDVKLTSSLIVAGQ
jgi:DNA-binding Lrp family transcriptional regulator